MKDTTPDSIQIVAQEPIFCPLCCAGYMKLLIGKIEIRTPQGDVHSAESRGLAAYLCRGGHVFFVCERDLEPPSQPKPVF